MGKVAIVTGATGTIGTSTCECLAAEGWTVVSADIIPPADSTTHRHYIKLDVTSDESVTSLFEEAAKFGDVLALVINHSILKRATAGTYDETVVQETIEVNLKGALRLLNLATARLGRDGSIVHVSSVTASIGGIQGSYIYQATKAGIEQLTRFFCVALGSRGIRVNCVAPGFMDVAMRGDGGQVRSGQSGSAVTRRENPLGRPVKAVEVANAIAFLCSSRASGINGVILPVDCGHLAS